MRERFALFVTDVSRFGPLAIISLATLACLPSLFECLAKQLTPAVFLGRYLVASLFATIGVRILSRVLLSYAHRNLTESERTATAGPISAHPDRP
jgi:hypothetical protein